MTLKWKDEARSVDPIIDLMRVYQGDARTDKINLGIGVFQDEAGNTPILKAVKEAEARLVRDQATKTYVGVGGDQAFVDGITEMIFGPKSDDVTGIQAVGGSGALRLIADFCAQVSPSSKMWVSNPTWGNHFPLFGASGLECVPYQYKKYSRGDLLKDILSSLEAASEGDFVCLHARCHNPTGIDLTDEEFATLAEFINDRGLVPVVDAAYLGFREGFLKDAASLGDLMRRFEVGFAAFSASKNFALYRERLGIAYVVGRNTDKIADWRSILLAAARANYSMPPDHGASVVRTIVEDDGLKKMWLDELEAARARLMTLRAKFAEALTKAGANYDTSYLVDGAGLFSLLPLEPEQTVKLREENGIYLLSNGRTNIAGLREDTIETVAQAVTHV